jgi:hypothetical protein
VKAPVPVPDAILEPAVVGFTVVAQQIPRSETVAPPSLVTLPPETAVVRAIAEASSVVTVGMTIAFVVNVTSVP